MRDAAALPEGSGTEGSLTVTPASNTRFIPSGMARPRRRAPHLILQIEWDARSRVTASM